MWPMLGRKFKWMRRRFHHHGGAATLDTGATKRGFTHPLARAAHVWSAQGLDGSERRILVIVTTMELDPKRVRYDGMKVERLSRAAKGYLARSSEATAFVLMNRPRDWPASL